MYKSLIVWTKHSSPSNKLLKLSQRTKFSESLFSNLLPMFETEWFLIFVLQLGISKQTDFNVRVYEVASFILKLSKHSVELKLFIDGKQNFRRS